jgi:hypothetical protein
MYMLLACSILLSPSTPEEFLDELCLYSAGEAGAQYWSEHASEEVQRRLADPDSLLILLRNKNQLTVDPGPRTAFEEQGESFRVEFGESSWNWTDMDGNANRKEGLSVVMVTDGRYTWSLIPILEEGSLVIGNRERLISGMMLTFVFLVVAVVLVAWARRRYL